MCHVLIIEDEAVVAMDLEQILELEGATSFAFAVSEEEAIAIAVAQPPDLITSDVKLVSGTGPSAVTAIHAKLGHIPVIFITGTPEACEHCAPGPVLTKPVIAREVVGAFHELRRGTCA